MATQYYPYVDAAGTIYPVALTDAQQAMYSAVVGTLPTGYASASALLAAISGSQNYPAGLSGRYVSIQDNFFGTAPLVVLTETQFSAIEPTGQTPYPTATSTYSGSGSITGASGEQRLSN